MSLAVGGSGGSDDDTGRRERDIHSLTHNGWWTGVRAITLLRLLCPFYCCVCVCVRQREKTKEEERHIIHQKWQSSHLLFP